MTRNKHPFSPSDILVGFGANNETVSVIGKKVKVRVPPSRDEGKPVLLPLVCILTL